MDWRSVRFDWNRARAFLVTAEEGSLSAAARALGNSQPAVGRQVAALEEELGVALFERRRNGMELTPTGLELIEHVRAMGSAATGLSLGATGRSQAIEGSVCISATEAMALFVLPLIIHNLRQAEPGIHIDLVASNSASDLKRREADIAIRSFRPTEPDLIAKKIANLEFRLYATTDYLQSVGDPKTAADFGNADFIGFDQNDLFLKWLIECGFPVTAHNFAFNSPSHLAQWEMVKAGTGIGVMPVDVGDAEPRVRRILPDLEPGVGEVWLVAHRELQTSRRIRVVYDFLASELTTRLRSDN